ncbi:MAG: hypothetical protein ACRDKE_12795 [Solirubrobacterales bacterium]
MQIGKDRVALVRLARRNDAIEQLANAAQGWIVAIQTIQRRGCFQLGSSLVSIRIAFGRQHGCFPPL